MNLPREIGDIKIEDIIKGNVPEEVSGALRRGYRGDWELTGSKK